MGKHVLYKSLAAAGLFILSAGSSSIPFLSKRFKTNPTLLGLANSLAGGIFLCAGLIHILPEALSMWALGRPLSSSSTVDEHEGEHHTDEELPDAELHDHDHHNHAEEEEFPWIPFTMLCSFILVLFVDRVLLPGHDAVGHNHGDHAGHDHAGHSHSNKVHDHQDHENIPDQPQSTEQVPIINKAQVQINQSEVSPAPTSIQAAVPKDSLIKIEETKKNRFAPYTIIIAFGVHAAFEGLALGLMEETAGFLGFLAAVCFHKWVESLAVGINLLKSKVGIIHRIIAIVIFALLTPIGVIIGLLIDDSNNKAKAIILSISGGTFLYIAIAEVVAEEFTKPQGRIYRFIAFLIGCGIMILAWFVERWAGGHHH